MNKAKQAFWPLVGQCEKAAITLKALLMIMTYPNGEH